MGSSRDLAPLSLADTLRPTSDITSRPIASGLFLLDPKTGLSCELNGTGARAFTLLAGGAPLRRIFEQLVAEYEVAQDVLERDLLRLVTELLACGMLERG